MSGHGKGTGETRVVRVTRRAEGPLFYTTRFVGRLDNGSGGRGDPERSFTLSFFVTQRGQLRWADITQRVILTIVGVFSTVVSFLDTGFLCFVLRVDGSSYFPGPLGGGRRRRTLRHLTQKSGGTHTLLVRHGLHLIDRVIGGCCSGAGSARSLVSVNAVKLVGTVSDFGPSGNVQLTACTDQYVRGRVLVRFHGVGGGTSSICLKSSLRDSHSNGPLALRSAVDSGQSVTRSLRGGVH